MLFQVVGQLQSGAQIRLRLIPGEPGAVRGDLKEHAAGFAEVDAVEVGAIPHGAYTVSQLHQFLPPGLLFRVIRGTESDVMDTAGSLSRITALRLHQIDETAVQGL